MKLGLIAGNGRFPFLVLDAARSLGHDVTVVALKEETFKELEEAAAKPPKAKLHWISIGELGACHSPPTTRRHDEDERREDQRAGKVAEPPGAEDALHGG